MTVTSRDIVEARVSSQVFKKASDREGRLLEVSFGMIALEWACLGNLSPLPVLFGNTPFHKKESQLTLQQHFTKTVHIRNAHHHRCTKPGQGWSDPPLIPKFWVYPPPNFKFWNKPA